MPAKTPLALFRSLADTNGKHTYSQGIPEEKSPQSTLNYISHIVTQGCVEVSHCLRIKSLAHSMIALERPKESIGI